MIARLVGLARSRLARNGLARSERITTIGLVLTAIWVVLILLLALLAPGGQGGSGGVARLVAGIGVVLPVALIWLGVLLARQLALLRAEAQDLRRRLRELSGDAAGSDLPQDGAGWGQPQDEAMSDLPPHAAGSDLPHHAAGTDAALVEDASLAHARQGPRPATDGAREPGRPAAPTLPLSPTLPRTAPTPSRIRTGGGDQRQAAMRLDAGTAPTTRTDRTDRTEGGVDPATLIRALNFPDGPQDHEAIEALRRALRDPLDSRVLRAAQDVVTLMAGRDTYMDDLPPDPARPDVWRRYAQGARGSAVAALGGIHQPQALDMAAAMIAEDQIFRDTAQHFLRHFDAMAARLVPGLDDLQIAVLADSRSGRAFMLLGRVSGAFG